jgi:hypothetical protein
MRYCLIVLIFLLLATASLALATAVSQSEAGLIAHWELDEDSGTAQLPPTACCWCAGSKGAQKQAR